jgi:hypothetical protein
MDYLVISDTLEGPVLIGSPTNADAERKQWPKRFATDAK